MINENSMKRSGWPETTIEKQMKKTKKERKRNCHDQANLTGRMAARYLWSTRCKFCRFV
jgi:hypothetical protein